MFCYRISLGYITMTQSTAGIIISWVAFIFLIIIGIDSSLRFADKMKKMGKIGVFEFIVLHRLWYPIDLGAWILLGVIVLFSKPFSSEWTVLVVISYIFILVAIGRRLFRRDTN